MRTYAQIERDGLCDTALAVGPDAPTLCEGWNVRDLMAHLAMRERRPEALGVVVPKLEPLAERTRTRYALRPFADLVDMVREGPHELSPFRLPGVDARANLSEYFIHHEDILRAQLPTADESAVRVLDEAEQDALYEMLPQGARLMLRASRCRVVAHCPGRTPVSLHDPDDAVGALAIVGLPSEIVLYLAGRMAFVEFEGEPDAINVFASESRGF